MNRNLVQLDADENHLPDAASKNLFQAMAANKINMAVTLYDSLGVPVSFSGVATSARSFERAAAKEAWHCRPDVCMVSIYPHHYRLSILGRVLTCMHEEELDFNCMVSSSSMLTFVIAADQCDRFVSLLFSVFQLPLNHTPFEQETDQDQVAFLKKSYPQTRASYVEDRIKTYRIQHETSLCVSCFSGSGPLDTGHKMLDVLKEQDDRFLFACARKTDENKMVLYVLTRDKPGDFKNRCVDLLVIQGPHFGDRYGIMSRTMDCLSAHGIPVVLSGSTGACITVTVPGDMGNNAIKALKDVFETP